MRIALAQINPLLGDFAGNRKKILSFTNRAKEKHCDLVIFPEAALFGYHPVDLLERESIVKAQLEELKTIEKEIPKNIGILLGAIVLNPQRWGKPYLNAAIYIEKGKKKKIFPKQLLPTYDVFDEGRHIQPGEIKKNILNIKGNKILVTICEDIWAWPLKDFPKFSRYARNPLLDVPKSKIDLVVNLSASPFTDTKFTNRHLVTGKTAKHFGVPLIYVNMAGAQDELIFDGGSFAINPKGKVLAQSIRFDEDLNVIDLKTQEGGIRELNENKWETIRQALVLGIRDFVEKTGFKRVHLGLSGGVDSALVACLAADALGPFNVTCVGLPGPFNAPQSLTLAKELSQNLGTKWLEFPITEIYEKMSKSFSDGFGEIPFSVVHENLQARIRAMFLMAVANQEKSLLLTTSNKSELAMGYSTLYGDMCGALMPIGDLLKTEVYRLAKLYNKEHELIPEEIITRPPSAELRPNQKDQDSLPPYEVLDPLVEKLVEGYSRANSPIESRILKSLFSSEFKRWQAPPILKVSDHAFGRGRRLPLAHKAEQ